MAIGPMQMIVAGFDGDVMESSVSEEIFAARWSGAIKPATDLVKQAKGYKLLNAECWITNERAARELTGTKFSKNVRRVKKENQMKIEAVAPLLEAQQQYGPQEVAAALSLLNMEGEAPNVVDAPRDN